MKTPDDILYRSVILTALGITDRCHRKWVQQGKFPAPDGNLHGRCFWRRETYERWQQDVLSGKYQQVSHLSRPSARMDYGDIAAKSGHEKVSSFESMVMDAG